MIPLVRRLVRALLWDELAVVRWLRGLTLALAVGGVALAQELAEAQASPVLVRRVRIAAAVAAFIAGAITAGQRNPRPPEQP